MEFARWLEVASGTLLVLLTIYDVFKSVVLPRPAINKFVFVRQLFLASWRLWKWISERLNPVRREGWLATFGPVLAIIMFAVWALLFIIGYGLMIDGLREEMRPGQDSSSTWRNRSVVDFVVKLKQAEHASEEDVLKEYRHAGLYKELAERLLQLGRENEALDVAQAHLTEPMEVTWFAEQLLKLGEAWREQALAFVETRLNELKPALQGKSQDFTSAYTVDTYRRWLSEKYLLYGKAKQALDMELARFQASPDHTTYRSVRSAAQAADQPEEVWSGLRPQLIRTLEQQGRWGALVTIYLDEGEVGQALAALAEMERAPRTSLYGYGYRAEGAPSHYQAQVAEAAEESYPDEAIRLYKSVVQRLIDGRGRENYQQATGYLVRIRRLYQKQGREPEWQAYITTLRNSNKSLRALKEELEKQGL